MSKTTLAWSQEVDRRQESLVALRRDFHRHPELSLQEHRTAQIIAERLHAAGLEVRTGIGGSTGVMGVLHGDRPGRTIAWRADIDALPLTELLEAACRPPRTYQHRWSPGDLAVWDNRCVLHRACAYDYREPREMKHTRVAGEASEIAGHCGYGAMTAR